MHALGHGTLALAAGMCARALVGGSPAAAGAMDGRSTWTGLLNVYAGANVALWMGFVGLLAAVVKGVGGTIASYWQARVAGEVGGMLRLEVLSSWLAAHGLRHVGHTDHGQSDTQRAIRDGASAAGHPPTSAVALAGVGAAPEVGEQARGVAALTSGVREVEVGLGVGLLGGARAVAQLVPLTVALVWIAPKLAAVALLVFLPFSLLLSKTRKGWKRAHARAAREGEALLEAADEAVRHADLWTAYGAEAKARATVRTLGAAIARQSARVEASGAALSGANEILGALALVAALAAGRAGWLGEAGAGGTLLSFTVAFFLAYKPLRDLTDARLAWGRAEGAFEGLRGVEGAGERDGEGAGERAGAGAEERGGAGAGWGLEKLELRGVRLGRGAGEVLSMSIEPGAIVAVLGPTGAGKTTLLRTLLGLDAALEGDIRYGGASLGDAPAGLVGRPFAWVPQDSPLLADTLEANVSLGANGGAREALESLGAARLLAELGTARLGAGGRAVSGGERQWIALARAIATRQPVLLLDEPTSGLDGAAQQRVLDSIARLRGHRSVVIVTHREEPLAIADAIVRLGSSPRGEAHPSS